MRKCIYHKRKERCLIKDKYPVTKDGKLSEKRIKAAETYGSKEGVLAQLRRGGLCRVARSKGLKLKTCERKK